MRFPVYPERHRRFAQTILKLRYYLLALLVVGICLFFLGWESGSNHLLLAGVFMGVAGALFFATFHLGDALSIVEISESGIRLLDKSGDELRRTEYRYVRRVEVRTLRITLISSGGRNSDAPLTGYKERIIFVYIDAAASFADLQIRSAWLGFFRKHEEEMYWCDQVFDCRNCIAFAYNDEAWALLQEHLPGTPANSL